MSGSVGPLHSMTGFGHAQVAHAGCTLCCELSSLNHRSFDLNFYAPPYLMKFEARLRQRVQGRVARGRLRMCMYVTGGAEPGQKVRFCEENLREYLAAQAAVERVTGVRFEVAPAALLTAPYVLVPVRDDFGDDEWGPVLDRLADECLGRLDAMRAEEGRNLALDLLRRTAAMGAQLARVEERAPALRLACRDKLLARVAEWGLGGKVPEERLECEVLFHVERADITEEVVRSRSHLSQFDESLREGGEVGRRLTFLVQELAREATTMGAKSADPAISRDVVLLKEELAKVREQVENLA